MVKMDFPQTFNSSTLFRFFPALEELSFKSADNASALYFLQQWVIAMRDDVTLPHKIWPQLKRLSVQVPHDDKKAAGEETVEDALGLLKSLRMVDSHWPAV